jgi:glucose/arabinose dehydrogenase
MKLRCTSDLVYVTYTAFACFLFPGHLQRVVFNENYEELRRESLLRELRQRIREVREGPDGLLYLLTDEDVGALLRVEPAL